MSIFKAGLLAGAFVALPIWIVTFVMHNLDVGVQTAAKHVPRTMVEAVVLLRPEHLNVYFNFLSAILLLGIITDLLSVIAYPLLSTKRLRTRLSFIGVIPAVLLMVVLLTAAVQLALTISCVNYGVWRHPALGSYPAVIHMFVLSAVATLLTAGRFGGCVVFSSLFLQSKEHTD